MSLILPKYLYGMTVLISIGTPIDGVGDRGFRAARRGRIGSNLATDKGEGRAEVALSGMEGAECDMN